MDLYCLQVNCSYCCFRFNSPLILLHSERPKLYGVLAVLSAIGFKTVFQSISSYLPERGRGKIGVIHTPEKKYPNSTCNPHPSQTYHKHRRHIALILTKFVGCLGTKSCPAPMPNLTIPVCKYNFFLTGVYVLKGQEKNVTYFIMFLAKLSFLVTSPIPGK